MSLLRLGILSAVLKFIAFLILKTILFGGNESGSFSSGVVFWILAADFTSILHSDSPLDVKHSGPVISYDSMPDLDSDNAGKPPVSSAHRTMNSANVPRFMLRSKSDKAICQKLIMENGYSFPF